MSTEGKKLKICGLKHRNEVVSAIREGVDFMGVVFVEKSKRNMGDRVEEVVSMAKMVREKGSGIPDEHWGTLPQLFGVFQRGSHATLEDEGKFINDTVKACNLHGAQLYGYTTSDYEKMKPLLDSVPAVVFSVSVSCAEDVKNITHPSDAKVKAICVDNKAGEGALLGGSGKAFDWKWLDGLRQSGGVQVFLAGGINAANAAEARSISGVDVLDVSSGVEDGEGKKSGALIRKVARAVRQKLPSYFGRFGGQFLPEILMPNLIELETKYLELQNDEEFHKEVKFYNEKYSGRPSLLYKADNLTKLTRDSIAPEDKGKKGAQIWLKREDLLHGGAHKINNGIGQALIAKRLGKHRIIAETGAGQHGVATATVCALMGLDGTVYMGETDTKRQRLNVLRIESMGAKVVPAVSGAKTLNAAVNEAFRDWASNPDTTYYLIGSCVGPHPFPTIVRDFQGIISEEARQQFKEANGGALPDSVVACVGGGSNCIGAFDAFVSDPSVELLGVEAGGDGEDLHSATLSEGTVGWFHGAKTQLLQTPAGQVKDTHSISAGLDYPAVGPEHAFLQDTGRARYVSCPDDKALEAFSMLAKTEGVLPALETSHAVYRGIERAKELRCDQHVIICVSGRGDKDMETIAKTMS